MGTYQEKTLHSVLKYYYEPEIDYHEVKLGRYIADIMKNHEIIEVQTGSFTPLKRKLSFFLPDYPVTIVYPIAHIKWILWVDPVTGEVTKKRKSPKEGSPYSLFMELCRIKDVILHEHLHIKIAMLDMEEYRYLDGWSTDRKKGSHRCDRIPVAFDSEIVFHAPEDYLFFVPEELYQVEFTVSEFGKCCHIRPRLASTTVRMLRYMGLIDFVGKRGKAYVYKVNQAVINKRD
ncbi:MAG: hypothetical protein HFE78_05465 [Clostridiales bacterium]|nr:hypothetical protein [Clostridiales bacterium]